MIHYKNSKLFLTLFILLLFGPCGLAQENIIDKWKTIDDESNKARSIIEIYKKGDVYYGKVTDLFLEADESPNPICRKCDEDDPRYMQPVIGMEIMKDMKKKGSEYVGGQILDPDSGKIYDCKLWIEDGNLKVRGYVAFFYRTQTWLRVAEN